MSVIDKVLRMGEGRQVKRLEKVAEVTTALEPIIKGLSDDELRGMTDGFKQRLEDGETLDAIAPEAFAVVREAARRTLGLRAFDVQITGAVALHRGIVAEMKTGEGKTLAAAFPAYLNALTGKGAHNVTVNDY